MKRMICGLLLLLSGLSGLRGSLQAMEYLDLVRAYADEMIENGRDRYGKIHSPLFAAALLRQETRLGKGSDFKGVGGVRSGDRSLGGSNPNEDDGLFGLLYKLSEVTGEARYAQAADDAIAYFWKHCQSPVTGLMAWGEHLYWDLEKDAAAGKIHEIEVPWHFWDQTYRLAPEAAWRYALGQWDHQIADQKTGDFSRHAGYDKHAPGKNSEFPRYAGQMIVDWADAYRRPENAGQERRQEMLQAIETVAKRMVDNQLRTKSGLLPALRGADYAWSTSNLELARCLWIAAPWLPEQLAEDLRRLALRQDEMFFKAPHRLDSGGGFACTLHTETGEPRSRSMNEPYSQTWASSYGNATHAKVAAAWCFPRYQQLRESHPEHAAQHRQLFMQAVAFYLEEDPPDAAQRRQSAETTPKSKGGATKYGIPPATPAVYAELIELMLAAHELTGEAQYLQRAQTFAKLGKELFLDDRSPLPKASDQHDHYEAMTGGDDFMYQLLLLHLAVTGA